MTQQYTPNDLVRYLYKDLPVTEYFEIEDALENDPSLRNMHQQLYTSYKALPNIDLFPSRDVMKNILRYSHTMSTEAHC